MYTLTLWGEGDHILFEAGVPARNSWHIEFPINPKVRRVQLIYREEVEACHVCCAPATSCPCDAKLYGGDEFCVCDHSLSDESG